MTLRFCHRNPAGYRGDRTTRIDLDAGPAPTIMAGGVNGDNVSHYWLEDDGMTAATAPDRAEKPPYRVPLMTEVAALPDNGYRVVSLFSGAGGSCLGFEMAGYRVLWANEFVPAAQETYRANHPDTLLDTNDIRTLSATAILERIGLKAGDVDVLEGSPPCASFSTAGKREDGWGKVKAYSDTRQRVDDLFFEYARLLGGIAPRVFVAENVSGLVKGTAKGYFKEILAALKAAGPGYVVRAQLLDAQWLGVPQMRQRIIFVGVRRDLAERYGVGPAFPTPLPYRYSVREALPWIVKQADNGGFGGGEMRDAGQHASPTIGAGPQTGNVRFPSALVEARVIHDTGGQFSNGDVTDRPCPTIVVGHHSSGPHQLRVETVPSPDHDTDISRYAIGAEWDTLKPGEQSERYFSLVRPDPESPWDTVTQKGGDVTAASVTHPTERRKFTIAELKRICAFPDDFVLTGSYAQQWERLGRAVPPVMMYHVAQVIRDEILAKLPRGDA